MTEILTAEEVAAIAARARIVKAGRWDHYAVGDYEKVRAGALALCATVEALRAERDAAIERANSLRLDPFGEARRAQLGAEERACRAEERVARLEAALRAYMATMGNFCEEGEDGAYCCNPECAVKREDWCEWCVVAYAAQTALAADAKEGAWRPCGTLRATWCGCTLCALAGIADAKETT